MKRILLITILSLYLIACGKRAETVWSDEFNYSGLPDSSKWNYEIGYVRNNEQQYYTIRRAENSIVKNGYLLLIARKESYNNYNYTSASINTLGKFSFRYGSIEARMKLPVGQGIWPAFRMINENKMGEIDIIEHINNNPVVYGTAHWYNNGNVSSGGTTQCDVRQFHNYAITWDIDSIRWLVDNKRYFGICVRNNVNSTEEFQVPFYILLNLAIGGNWPKNPDSTTFFPDTLYVDYIRVTKSGALIMK